MITKLTIIVLPRIMIIYINASGCIRSIPLYYRASRAR